MPLLVVSEYTPAGYVSGNTVTEGGEQPQWEHDFGSILRFTENNFNLPYIYWPYYADANTLDSTYQHQAVIPLWDFFLNWPNQLPFTYISPILSSHTASFFMGYYQTPENGVNPQPVGPENGDPGD